MKKLIALLFITLTITACGSKTDNILEQIDSQEEIVVAVSPDYPPYEFIDASKSGQDQYVGADVQLAKYIAEHLDVKLTIKAMDFSDIPSAVALQRFDLGISGFTYSDERAEQIQFSNAYDNSESTCQGFLVHNDNMNDFNNIDDFKDSTIVVQNGSLQQNYLEAQLPEANERPIAKLDDAVLELKYGKVDAVAISCEAAKSFTLNNDDISLSEVKFDIIDEEGMMIIMPKEQTELLNKINAILDEVSEQGLYSEWMDEANTLAEELGEVMD